MKRQKGVFHVLGAITGFFVLFGTIITSYVYAESSIVDEINITIPASCSLTGTVGSNHAATIETGVYQENIGETTFKVFCNDSEGFAVYAIGYTDDEYSNTTLKPATIPQENAIVTGTATSGETSNWAMKLTVVSGDFAPTLETGFNTYHVIPELYTKVVSFSSNTDATNGSSFKSTYSAYISGTQLADSYTGKVKYTVIHPANAATPITPTSTMQDMSSVSNPDGRNSAVICTSEPSYVVDSRDDNVYTIQRLADGNCWMMENLDLGRTELTVDLTSENTNLRDTITAATFNSWKRTTGSGNDYSMFISVDGTDAASNTPYGTLYTFRAASAGMYTGTISDGNIQYDICPAGWRLPTGGNNGEYMTLYNILRDSGASMRAPILAGGGAFALSGIFSTGEPSSVGTVGYYWSSTKPASDRAYVLTVGDSSAYNGSLYHKVGVSIRCILNEPPKTISDLTYLQDFRDFYPKDKASVLNSMEYNTTYNLIDNRDNRTYAIAKLKDNNIWMAENLDLGRTELTGDLTSANTNLTTTIIAETFNSWNRETTSATYTSARLVNISGSDSVFGTPYGTLYNYCATSAGTICSAEDENNDNATSDICPAGWRLPTGGGSGEFQSLYDLTDYDTSAKMRAPIVDGGAAFALSGFFYTLTPNKQGSSGSYWSSTRYNGAAMYAFHLLASQISTTDGYSRGYGFAVRCIVDI